jgi:DNA invertase Pin-like site-specific DNA recombinase
VRIVGQIKQWKPWNMSKKPIKQSRKPRHTQSVVALGYVRTSSDFNAQDGKASEPRQREAIERFAEYDGYAIAPDDWFNDSGVSGTMPLTERPAFMRLLQRIASNGVRVVLVEDASRFARDTYVAEAGIAMLVRLGVKVFTASGIDLTETDDPTKVAIRQMLGVMAQLDRAQVVKRLKHGRDKAKAEGRSTGGKRPMREVRPEVVIEAKRLRRASPLTGERLSFKRIGEELAKLGHLTTPKRKGDEPRPFTAPAVKIMCDGPRPKRADDGGE